MDGRTSSDDREPHSADVRMSETMASSVSGSQSGAASPNQSPVKTTDASSDLERRGCILRSLLSRPSDDEKPRDDGGPHRDALGFASGHRPRSRSMGTAWWSIPEVVSSTSQDSLECGGAATNEPGFFPPGAADRGSGFGVYPLHTDRLIEVARCKLMTLNTSEDRYHATCRDRLSISQPGSPPRGDAGISERLPQHRKYSEGSRLKACLQGLRTGFRTPDSSEGLPPVDFSCRRRKRFEGVPGLPYARPAPGNPAPPGNPGSSTSTDEGLGEDSGSAERSILKSILIGRCRSNTISSCGSRSRYDAVAVGNRADQSQRFARQPVALAKKNLHPVMAKINDCINQVGKIQGFMKLNIITLIMLCVL